MQLNADNQDCHDLQDTSVVFKGYEDISNLNDHKNYYALYFYLLTHHSATKNYNPQTINYKPAFQLSSVSFHYQHFMRPLLYILLAMLPLTAFSHRVDSLPPQGNVYFNKPEVLQSAGVKWVNQVFKDSRGLMWFATDNGLFRFDGTNVLYAHHKIDDSTTIPSNDVGSVAEDKQGNIWVGTAKGGTVMDPNTLTSTRVRHENGSIPGYKINFLIDADGAIWARSDGGLLKYNRQTNLLQHVWTGTPGDTTGGQIVSALASWSKDELVAGTLGDVVFINKHDFSYHRISLIPGMRVDVSTVTVDANNRLWVGTWGHGLFVFNPVTQSFSPFAFQKNIAPGIYTVITQVASLTISSHHFLYVGLPGGLIKVALESDGLTQALQPQLYYTHQAGTEGSLPGGSVMSLYQDESNNLWIGCDGDIGIAKIALTQSLIYTLPVQHEGNVQTIDKISSHGKNLYAVCSWHGSTGLLLMDDKMNVVKTFDKLPEKADHDAVNISSVGVDKYNRYWVSSWRGITVLDDKLQVVKVLDHNTKGPDTLYKEKNNFLLVSNDSVWIASYKRGIDLFTTDFKRLKHYTVADNKGLAEDLIWKFYRSRTGKIWLIGNAFLYSYDAAADRFTPYKFSKDNAAYGPVDIAEKKDGTLLIATATGLIHFNPANGWFEYIRTPLLDKEDNVNAVSLDEEDNIWYLTDEHLVYYNANTKVFTLYGKQDGLDIADNLFMMRYIGHNQVLIGQYNKLVVFTAPNIAGQNKLPGLLVTGVYVNDSLTHSKLPTGGLNLSYTQNKINIAFACVNYNRAEQNIYAYRLKNADTAWTYSRTGNVTYANLSPGQYTFEVKAANYALVWSKVSAFTITIHPPFWQSWWFRALLVCAIISGTYFVFRRRVAVIRKEEKTKTELNRKMAELEMKALRAQMNPHFVFNSLSSIQESIVTGKTEAASKYLSKFSKLIRLILENSGKQFIPLKTEIDLLTLYLELESFRFENFTYTFSVDPQIDVHFTTIPSMVIQPFIENALKHGLSKKKENKHLKIDIHKAGNKLVAVIEDNGVGRSVATAIKSLERKDHHSMGIQITEERLQLLGMQTGGAAAEITDLFDDEGKPTGTLVKVVLPAEDV